MGRILLNKTVQSKSTTMFHILSTKIVQRAEQLVGLFFKKGALEFVVKILDKHTTKSF